MKRWLIPGALGVLVLAYPLLVSGFPVYERLGALVLLAAIGASAWNIVGGYAGQVSVGHSVFFGFGAYSSVVVYTHLGWPPIAGASARTLSRLFAAQTGMTFRQWQRQLRLLTALELLAQGRTVTDVALDVGYDSPSAFISVFRQSLGTTPRRYFAPAQDPAPT